jgi:2-keto-4-pentenoate hydratase/2-oxohepta-3-ene-1,7-dioic acid hydratase in catechol pathway
MLYVRFLHSSTPVLGIVSGNQVKMVSSITPDEDDEFVGDLLNLGDLHILPPVQPSKIVAVSTNYSEVLELLGKPAPNEPLIFFKSITAVIGQDDAIIYPNDSGYVTYEPELAVIIGRECYKVSEDEALTYVHGYTCANDLSARDIQNREVEMARCKSYSTFAPLGPFIQTEIDPSALNITGYVNGKAHLQTTTANMIFTIAEQIAFISRIMPLMPGDVILSGACGVGEVKVGDVVEIEIENVGRLRNHVIAEST